ncbi:MAG: lytic murein transglycosylase B [Proteobacteria bacterium]|nr:lytic murein transglycosylase B [Pseudomonadota bacterium]
MQNSSIFKTLIAILCLVSLFSVQAEDRPLSSRADVKAFIKMMVSKHHFNEAKLTKLINSAKIQPSILKAIAKPAEKLTWERYEPIFLTPKRIDEGVAFWKQNKAALTRAEKEYGVPAEIIVAIIGVETFYGKQAGQYSVLDSLVTLGFDYPPRSKFFLSELEEFLLLAREQHWDPAQVKGSYAGAMGKPQFIASSYRRYAIDFNKKGNRDLINNVDDAIGSVANYFKLNGWKKGEPVVLAAKVKGDKFKEAIASSNNPKPDNTLQKMTSLGIVCDAKNIDSNKQFALIGLEGKAGPEYWLGAHNFYVITRYNRSSLYAMAVYNLSEKIKSGYHQA